jgi:hypothetical protein
MRQIQIGVFIVGLVSFLAALFFIGQDLGDTLWRVGVAAMLVDIAAVRLWPLVK